MLRYVATLALLLAAPLTAPQAATIYHCKGPDGRITYSQLGCPDDQRIASQETAPAHGEAEYLLPPAKPERIVRRSRKEAAENRREITVVGERQDGCDNRITGTERRQAMLRKQVRTGMTQRDVESMLGKPDRITRSNGMTRYHYTPKKGKGRSQVVAFDEQGCVKGRR
ncbi:DUF4124 domain-containing protein [Metapseudomonas otitidis]|uniref:DUF4124 domain-containing protein n=1 Tax=Metapseudomonas otitidis TaxID=319939 RepID=UPI00280A6E98|nr:DUF4124 domain-containing protein [Pseudomonas otitidis]